MSCCHPYFASAQGGPDSDSAFTIDASTMIFGDGCLSEAGDHARAAGIRRIALFTDRYVRNLPPVATVLASLQAAGIDCVIYDDVEVEPTDASFRAAARFATEGSQVSPRATIAANHNQPPSALPALPASAQAEATVSKQVAARPTLM